MRVILDIIDSGAWDVAIASALIVLCGALIVKLIEGDKT